MKKTMLFAAAALLLAGCSGQSVVRSMVPAQAKRPPFVKTDQYLKVSNLYGPDVHITLGVTIALMAHSMPRGTNWGEPVLLINTRRSVAEGWANWTMLSDSDGKQLPLKRVSQQANPTAIARDATQGALDEALAAQVPIDYLATVAVGDWRMRLYGEAGATEDLSIPAIYTQNFLQAYDTTAVPAQR